LNQLAFTDSLTQNTKRGTRNAERFFQSTICKYTTKHW